MVAGANAFVTVSAPSTESVALAAAALEPPLVVVSAPIGIALLYVPAAALVTFTVTVHEPEAGTVPAESATRAPPLPPVPAPAPQVVAPAGAAGFSMPPR